MSQKEIVCRNVCCDHACLASVEDYLNHKLRQVSAAHLDKAGQIESLQVGPLFDTANRLVTGHLVDCLHHIEGIKQRKLLKKHK